MPKGKGTYGSKRGRPKKSNSKIVKTVVMDDGRKINFVSLFDTGKDEKRKTIREMSDKEIAEMKKRLDLKKSKSKKFRR